MPVITAVDVKPHLNMGASTVNNTEIEALIPGVEASVAQRIGPLASTATTVVVNGSRSCVLPLPAYPVVSVTSVTGKSGSTVTITAARGWDNGLLYAEDVFSEDYYTVVYNAGRTAASMDDVKQALAMLVAADWIATHRGGDAAPVAAGLRSQAEALLAPYMLVGFA